MKKYSISIGVLVLLVIGVFVFLNWSTLTQDTSNPNTTTSEIDGANEDGAVRVPPALPN